VEVSLPTRNADDTGGMTEATNTTTTSTATDDDSRDIIDILAVVVIRRLLDDEFDCNFKFEFEFDRNFEFVCDCGGWDVLLVSSLFWKIPIIRLIRTMNE